MAVPSMFTLIIPAFFNADKCWETVGCAKGNSFTISLQIQVFTINKYSTIAILAGCDKALNNVAN